MTKQPVVKKGAVVPPCSGISVALIKSRKNSHVLILRASGKFASHECLHCGEEFAENLQKAFASGRKNFILNLAGITVLDAIGIGVLATFMGKCSKPGINLVWCAARPHVKSKLLVSRLIYVAPYYRTEEEALKFFS